MRWMEIAWADLGVKETAGPEATPKILAYFRDAGRADIASDEVSWCAAFANAALSRSGIKLDAIPPGERLLARACLKQGTPIEEPRVGAVCVLRRGEPWQGHVGFVTAWTASKVKLLGGNQANSVSEVWYDRHDVVGYRWPEAPATAKEIAARGSRIAKAAERQQKDLTKAGGTGGSGQVVPAPPPTGPLRREAMEQARDLANDASSFKSMFEMLESFAMFAWGKFPYIAGGVALYFLGRMAYDAWIIKHARVEDANEGWSPVVADVPEEAADGVL